MQFRYYHGQQYATRRKDEKSGPSMIMEKEQVWHAALIGSFLLISLREHFVLNAAWTLTRVKIAIWSYTTILQ